MGKILIIIGISFIFLGIFVYFLGDKLNWFGNLPLDFSYKSDRTQVYAPIGSMIVVSIILSLIMNIFYRFFK
tara:strand:+ start:4113 stop:4328 length:216 start_codon:yes stop_codon:yes gene_type:complete